MANEMDILIDRVCRGIASIQEGEQLRAYIRQLERPVAMAKKSTKVTFSVKDSDVLYQIEDEDERQKFKDAYAEFGEYFVIEIDLVTKQGRMLPRSEWK